MRTIATLAMKAGRMSRSIKSLYGTALSAKDGEIGVIKDCYFDDRHWAVRYLVVDTGTWLADRKVLISPHALAAASLDERILRADLSIAQIEASPSIDRHKPVSRQYEEDYYKYFGWPYYWQGDGIWGVAGVPVGVDQVIPAVDAGVRADRLSRRQQDKHLHSTLAVAGYQVMALDGPAGHVHDFFMDSLSWAIRSVSMNTGHWYNQKLVSLATRHVTQIDFDGSSISVDLTLEQIASGSGSMDAPQRHAAPPHPALSRPTQAEIAAAAYGRFALDGHRPGNDVQHWLAAEDLLRAENIANRASVQLNVLARVI
jgi:hypothetical protein